MKARPGAQPEAAVEGRPLAGRNARCRPSAQPRAGSEPGGSTAIPAPFSQPTKPRSRPHQTRNDLTPPPSARRGLTSPPHSAQRPPAPRRHSAHNPAPPLRAALPLVGSNRRGGAVHAGGCSPAGPGAHSAQRCAGPRRPQSAGRAGIGPKYPSLAWKSGTRRRSRDGGS